jgi:hypothetical protein
MTSPDRPARPAPLAPPDSPHMFERYSEVSPHFKTSTQPLPHGGRSDIDPPRASAPPSQPQKDGGPSPPMISLEVLEMIAAQQADAYHQKLREIAEHELRLQKWADALNTKQEKLEQWERRLGQQERDLAESTSQLRGDAGRGFSTVDPAAASFAERLNVFRRDSLRQHDASVARRSYSINSGFADDV